MVLQRLGQYFDNKDAMTRKIKTAMAYPIFVLGFVTLMIVVIMTFIIPRFQVIFTQVKGDLPAFTKGFMKFYEISRDNVIFLILGVAAAVIGVTFYNRTPAGHERISRMLLKIPLLGKVISQGFISMFCRTMATLLSAGVSVIDALNIMVGMSNNEVIKAAIKHSGLYCGRIK